MAPRKDARAAVLATWIARFLTAVAIFCVVTALFPGLRSVLEPVRDLIELTTIGAQPNLAYAAYLGILAAAVRRRKRIAWWFLVLLLIVPNMVYDVAEVVIVHHGLLSLAVLTAVLVILVLARPAFDAEVAPRAGWRALATVAVAVVVGFVLGMAALTLFPGQIASVGDRAATALVFLTGGTNATTNRFDVFRELASPPPPHPVTVFLGLLGAAVQLAGAWVLFRPRRKTLYQTPDDDRQLRALLTTYAEDSLGYFATRQDKSAIFAPSGAAAVTYRVVAGVSLASGDPVGDPRQWPAAIRAWLAEARRYAWAPAVMGTTAAGAHAYADAGLHVLEFGDEAVLRVADFDLAGRRMRGVRQAVQRLERLGYTCRIRRHADIPAEEFAEIGSDADRWRGTQGERGFSMALGRLGDPRDGRCVLVECLDRHGYRRALLSFAPWGRRGLSLDLMRRSPAAPNGVVELMVSRLVEAARALGVDRISLNFAIFRSGLVEGAEIGAGPVARMWRRTLLLASRWWQIEALYRANAKFEPEWVTRFLCYPRSRDLPRIAVASGIAEGLVPVPVWPGRRLRRGGARGLATKVPQRAGTETAGAAGLPAAPGAVGGAGAVQTAAEGPAGGGVRPGEEPAADLDQLEAHRERALPEQERVRRDKLRRLRAEGVDPYPVGYPRTASAAEVAAEFACLGPDTWTSRQVGVAGRVVGLRTFGGLGFATVRDGTGDLQVMLDQHHLTDPAALARWKHDVDLGDHVGVTGHVGTTRSGELTVRAIGWALTAKCLRPLPDKWHGRTDPEARVRERAVDLATRPGSRVLFAHRRAVVAAVRDTLRTGGYEEVETPMLQPVHGGANARPFSTHINAYDLPLYLRIAPELYLKRLLVGGLEQIFELNRNFRNEGADATHNPEFTMLEAYQAYGDYHSMRVLACDLVRSACRAVHGGTVLTRTDPHRTDGATIEVDLAREWPVVSVHAAVSAALGEEVGPGTDAETLRRYAARADVHVDAAAGAGAAVLAVYEALVEPNTVGPTFYTDFPTEVSPLTRPHRDDPRLAERWDLVVFGVELGTAYSELADPVEQRRRLTAQSLLAAGGDPEAMQLDEDFLRTLEYGMPPAGGLGLGIDRLVMTLTGRSIRETLLFPLVRPRGDHRT
ncbi:bifunctional lysylphosphatidylglycerol synthetase/lysine--tRNA ligase LysX [Actinopolymorpha singaporensis]|uniref:Lysine--tRNA ligase n=1 Tax=Actinopolymorpha singaporensis TaxID=117157 RepID=A0A1H1VB52_9ACTN|nr:bifunctional lysylphosphatidylglycerol synthetase/lysine--tRNA ligase LysX [Actinopolymorpha singaporensis]SDS81893.1 lysyl-tRNA synthetase, class II [Actinopolymorpha singaporensis]